MKITDNNLFSKFEIQGIWWLPDSPNHRAAGTLFVDGAEGLILELIGENNQNDFFRLDIRINPQIILGMTKEGPCTLYQNLYTSGGFSTSGISYPKYSANYLFFGEHFNTESELKFSSAMINYNYLEEWVGTRQFTNDLVMEGEVFAGWKIAFHKNEDFSAYVPSLDSEISIFHGCANSGGDYHSIALTHTAFLNIAPREVRDFFWLHKTIYALRDLFSLFVGEPAYPKEVLLLLEKEEAGQSRTKTVNLFFKQPNKQINSSFHPMDIIVPLDKIKDNISEIIEAFFLSREKLKPVYGLLLGTYYNPSPYIHYQFLNLMQALEAFQRRTSEEDIYIPKPDYKIFRKTLEPLIEQAFERYKEEIKKTPPPGTDVSSYVKSLEDLKGLVIGRISQCNSVSLQTRIISIFEELPEGIKQLVTNNIDDFGRKLVKTRDDLTHHIEKANKNILTGTEIVNAVGGLEILLTFLLLNELKITKPLAEELILKTERFKGYTYTEVKYDTSEISEQHTVSPIIEEEDYAITESGRPRETKNKFNLPLTLISIGIGATVIFGNLMLLAEKRQLQKKDSDTQSDQ